MADIGALNYAWRNFSAERGKARLELLGEIEARKDQINKLQAEITEMEKSFDAEWKERKAKRKEALDNAVMAELASGRSAQDVLRELGSNNTVWIYKLRTRALEGQAEHKEPEPEYREQAPSGQMATVHPITSSMPVFQQAPQSVPDGVLEGVSWLHHDHTGVHGWLVSTEGNYVKHYGAEGTPAEDKWFVADRDHNFVAGDLELFEKTPQTEFIQRVTMLHDLLSGKYPPSRIRISPNKYRA